MAPSPVLAPPAKLALVSPSGHQKPPKILLKTINPQISCSLCKGYLVEATTIVECLHSFCHSCLMKHLSTENYCPRCEMMINKAKPNIKYDATLQSIVYKLVSGLYEKELLRKRVFYKQHPEQASRATPEQRGDDTENLIFSPNEQISLSLEYADLEEFGEDNEELKRPKYLQCPAIFTVAHLKKFIVQKFGINTSDFYVEIMYKVKTIVLPDHYTLMDVAYIYTWKRETPMRYFYRVLSHKINLHEVPSQTIPSVKSNINTHASSSISTTQTSENAGILSDAILKSENCLSDNKKIDTQSKIVLSDKNNENQVKSENVPSAHKSKKVKSNGKEQKSEVRKYTKKVKKEKTDEKKQENIKLIIDLAKQQIKSEGTSTSNVNNSLTNGNICNNKLDNNVIVKKEKTIDKISSINRSQEIIKPIIKSEMVSTKPVIIKKEKSPIPNSNLHPVSKIELKTKSPNKLKNNICEKAKLVKTENITPPQSPNLGQSTSTPVIENDDLEIKKSEFLNSFQLTPRKSLSQKKIETIRNTDLAGLKLLALTISSMPQTPTQSTKTSSVAEISTISQPTQSSQPSIKITLSKRKSNDLSARSLLKKSRLEKSDSPFKNIVEYKIKDNKPSTSSLLASKEQNNSISFDLCKYPIGSKTTSPNKSLNQDSATINKTQKTQKSSENIISNKILPKPNSTTEKSVPKLDQPKTSIVVNNLTRPNQPDTPRPPSIPKSNTSSNNKTLKSPIACIMKPPLPPPFRKKLPPILPKKLSNGTPPPSPNPHIAPLVSKESQKSIEKISNMASTEIKKIKNDGKNSNVKVYGPAMDHSKEKKIAPQNPPPLSYVNSTGNVVKNSMSGGYLNYALMNASINKMAGGPNGGDTPAHIPLARMSPAYNMRSPRYTPNSPIYSPNSPQYTPNYNIPTQPQYKYMKTPVYAPSFLQNFLPKPLTPIQPKPAQQPSISTPSKTSPPPKISSPPTVSSTTNKKPNPKAINDQKTSKNELVAGVKRPATVQNSKNDASLEPPEKQKKVQSLLDSCNISLPSSLSITLTNDKDESLANPLFNKRSSSPVNNYIEILKLKDTPSDVNGMSTSPPIIEKCPPLQKNEISNSTDTIDNKSKPIPKLNPVVKNSTAAKNAQSFQECYLQSIKNKDMSKFKSQKPQKPPRVSKKSPKSQETQHNLDSTSTYDNMSYANQSAQLTELQQKSLWDAAPPQSLPAYLNDAAVRALAAQNSNIMSQLYHRALLMRLHGNKAIENLYQQNMLNNNNTETREES